MVKTQGKEFPANDEGERRTFFFLGITDTNELIKRAKAKLENYYYTGFKGTFTTFGIPFVAQGDNVYLVDKDLPERNGYYKVKSVAYKGGTSGLRQEITVDYLIRNLTDAEIKKYG